MTTTDMTPTAPTVQGTRTGLAQPHPERRTPAWNLLGTAASVDGMTDVRAAMDQAGLLGWNVHKRPLETASLIPTEDGGSELVNPLPIKSHFATVRSTPEGEYRALGVVGARYTPIQNEEYLPLFETVLANEPGATVTAAGALRGGERAFVSLRVPELDVPVGGVDPVEMYLIGQNSHDGSSGFHFALTPVRLFCTNQLRGLREGKGVRDRWVVRHTRNYEQQLGEVRVMLSQARGWAERFSQDADALLRTAVSDAMFSEVMASLWGTPAKSASKAAVTRHETREQTLQDLWRDSVTLDESIRGTAWGMFNVVTEYVDHYQAAGVGRGYTTEQARADRNMVGRDETAKARAWQAALELV